MYKPEGITVAMVTPFQENEEINESMLRKLVNRYKKVGLHGIFCLSTNGEFFTLTKAEKLKIVEIVVEEAAGDIPVWAGTGAVTTKEAVSLSVEVERIGADAVSVITPYFLTPDQEELYQHYLKIAEAVNIPVILYNLPGRTGNSINPETAGRLSQIDNIVGLKDSSGDFSNILKFIEETETDFKIFSGSDELVYWTLMAGGDGAVCGTANVLPRELVSIYDFWEKGEIEKAQKTQENLGKLFKVFKYSSFPAIVKALMKLEGYEVGAPRKPIQEPASEVITELRKVLEYYEKL